MSETTYSVELAPTGRAKCRNSKCKNAIAKGVPRVKKVAPAYFDENVMSSLYYHVPCFFDQQSRARKTTHKVTSLQEFEGLDDAAEAARSALTDALDTWLEQGSIARYSAEDSEDDQAPAAKEKAKTSGKKRAKPESKRAKVEGKKKKAKKGKGSDSIETKAQNWEYDLVNSSRNGKVWRARVEGKSMIVEYGASGGPFRTHVSSLSDEAAARAKMEKAAAKKQSASYESV